MTLPNYSETINNARRITSQYTGYSTSQSGVEIRDCEQ